MGHREDQPQNPSQVTEPNPDQANANQQGPHPGTPPSQESVQRPVTYFVDPATGQIFYGVAPQQTQMLNPIQPPNPAQYVLYAAPQGIQAGQIYTQVPPQPSAPQQDTMADQGSAQRQASQPDYAQLLKTVENFAQGNATVSDVVKDLYTQTAEDDQFWKGAVVGAAAAVLLNSNSVRQAMGKTFGALFGGAAGTKAATENAAQATKEDK